MLLLISVIKFLYLTVLSFETIEAMCHDEQSGFAEDWLHLG